MAHCVRAMLRLIASCLPYNYGDSRCFELCNLAEVKLVVHDFSAEMLPQYLMQEIKTVVLHEDVL